MKRILVVDDDQDSCELLREIFSAEGWQVDTALTPSQAFNVAKKIIAPSTSQYLQSGPLNEHKRRSHVRLGGLHHRYDRAA